MIMSYTQERIREYIPQVTVVNVNVLKSSVLNLPVPVKSTHV